MGSRKRQLALPLPVVAASPLKRARRDWNKHEFRRALYRNGFSPECDSLRYVDLQGPTGARVHDAVARRNPIRIARRATLAKLLRIRKQQGDAS